MVKFKHYATDEIIEVEPVDTKDNTEIVYCKKLNKYFEVIGDDHHLKGTSYMKVN